MPAYAEIRKAIRSGDLLAWSGRSLGAAIIRRWTGERISHVGLAMWIGPRLFSIEARPGVGVTMRLLSTALPVEWSPLALGQDQWARAEERALLALGRGYSWLDAILAGLGLPTRQWDKYQCAELVASLLTRAGWPPIKTAPRSQRLIPGHLQSLALKAGRPVEMITKGERYA